MPGGDNPLFFIGGVNPIWAAEALNQVTVTRLALGVLAHPLGTAKKCPPDWMTRYPPCGGDGCRSGLSGRRKYK
ncbi:hypothetical protein ABH15_04245 [Methanoculleus taiwanensis]|uniref:Uncharacterized protein n=1 Tax=Methanoculleus taiwanensis TaxID=1550565 RepID=A0A498H4G0_9EURY|nr:hypothetical protein ABH15_04245 [Methanoculleus taiwanensis]